MSKLHWTFLLLVIVGLCQANSNHTERVFNQAYFYTDINSGGYQLAINSWMTIGDLNAYNPTFFTSISSLGVVDPNTMAVICTGYSISGNCYAFIYTPVSGAQFVNSLFSYPTSSGNLNDQAKSLKTIQTPIGGASNAPGVILYADNNYQGLSTVHGSGAYTNFLWAYNRYGSFFSDTLSSYIVLPYTRVAFFVDDNYVNLFDDISNPTANYLSTPYMVATNDLMSSFRVGPCTTASCPSP